MPDHDDEARCAPGQSIILASSPREPAPGGLDTIAETVVEGFALQEALRYRAALIEIELLARLLAMDEDAPPEMRVALAGVSRRAGEALDAGDEAAG